MAAALQSATAAAAAAAVVGVTTTGAATTAAAAAGCGGSASSAAGITVTATTHHQKPLTTANDILGLPNFAIVRIPEGGDIIKLFSLLLNNGFPEVSFVNEIRENAFLPVLNTTAAPVVADLTQFSNTVVQESVVSSDDNNSGGDRSSSGPLLINEDAPNNTGHPSPAPSSSTSIQGLSTTATAIPSPIPFVARPRGSRTVANDDPSLYAVCQLCQNKIMSSRLSNLTNHVRRHASLKQFQCVYCIYTHNEMAKVRLHMQHNHKDHISQPLDALTPEMQNQWDLLMDQCFPGYSKFSAFKNGENDRTIDLPLAGADDASFACIECGERVNVKALIEHLEKVHKSECIPYCCEECGYQNADQWKVRLHITLSHSEIAADVNVEVLEPGNLVIFLHKYFPDTPADEEETRMLSQFQSLLPKEERASVSPSSFNGSVTSVVNEASDAGSHVRCEESLLQLCQKTMPNYRSLSSLMNHAKRHYHLKQYQCSECFYTSSEAAHVRTHMAIKHPHVGAKPIDNNCETLQNAWIEVMRKCFPALITKIDQFRFKHSRSEDGCKEENSIDGEEETVTYTRGKRKSNHPKNHTATTTSPQRKLQKLQQQNGKSNNDDNEL